MNRFTTSMIAASNPQGIASATSVLASFLSLTVMVITLWMAEPACAGMVSGEAKDGSGKLANAEIEVKDARNNRFLIKTDNNGKFNINLPPGIYKATSSRNRNKTVLLQSSPQPSSQDLDFGGR